MLTMILAAQAAELSVGGFLGLHVSDPQHELYAAREKQHSSLGPAFGLGGRLGLRLLGPLVVEGEAATGPVTGVGGGLLYGWRGQATLVGRDVSRVRPLLTVGLGNLGVVTQELGDDVDLAAHAGLGALVPLAGRLALRGDLRWMPSARAGRGGIAHHGELLVGLQYSPRVELGDRDRDGVDDTVDACPREPEVHNGHQDEDGCPDALAAVILLARDPAGQPVADVEVRQGEVSVGRTDAGGRWTREEVLPGQPLVFELLGEGRAPVVLETEPAEGPNELVAELDWARGTTFLTVRDPDDHPLGATVSAEGRSWTVPATREGLRFQLEDPTELSITAPGHETLVQEVELEPTGATRVAVVLQPEQVQVEVQPERVTSLESIRFRVGSEQVQDDSLRVLDALARTLAEHPELVRIEVGGHASAEGSDAANLALSRARAQEVRRLLVQRGVASSRLTAKGYGESKPIASNDDEAGRRQNRRVELTIVERR